MYVLQHPKIGKSFVRGISTISEQMFIRLSLTFQNDINDIAPFFVCE